MEAFERVSTTEVQNTGHDGFYKCENIRKLDLDIEATKTASQRLRYAARVTHEPSD